MYKGDKARRAELQKEINSHEFHVVLTTYEVGGVFFVYGTLKWIYCEPNSVIHSFVSKMLHS